MLTGNRNSSYVVDTIDRIVSSLKRKNHLHKIIYTKIFIKSQFLSVISIYKFYFTNYQIHYQIHYIT